MRKLHLHKDSYNKERQEVTSTGEDAKKSEVSWECKMMRPL